MPLQHRKFTVGNLSFDHFFLCRYRPKHTGGQDRLSQSLLRFKDGREPDTRAWIECSVGELVKKFSRQNVSVMRALGHLETEACLENPMGMLCERLTRDAGVWDATNALGKIQPTPKLSLLGRRKRYEKSVGNYIVKNELVPSDRILVIDDILTSGATMTGIINAIKEAIKEAKIKLFTFAISDYSMDTNTEVILQGYDENLTHGNSLVNESMEMYSESYESLVRRILQDDF